MATPTPEQERAAIEQVRKAMRKHLADWFGVNIRTFPKKRISSTETHKIDKMMIVGAVALFVVTLGLAAGSSGDFNLYNLLTAYLHDDQARAEMNEAADAWTTRSRTLQRTRQKPMD